MRGVTYGLVRSSALPGLCRTHAAEELRIAQETALQEALDAKQQLQQNVAAGGGGLPSLRRRGSPANLWRSDSAGDLEDSATQTGARVPCLLVKECVLLALLAAGTRKPSACGWCCS